MDKANKTNKTNKRKNKMKKILVMAMVAVSAIASFGACSYVPATKAAVQDSAWAYKWKFTGKTTKAIAANCSQNNCVTRTPASLKIQGYTFYCNPQCGDFENLECDETFWVSKPSRQLFGEGSGVTFEVANVIGKKGDKFEVYGTAKFDDLYALNFAGVGKYDRKNGRVSSIKGMFTGVASAPSLTIGKASACSAPDFAVSKVWGCCGCPTAVADTVAFGKFSVKYAKSHAKKYAKHTLKESSILPSWAR